MKNKIYLKNGVSLVAVIATIVIAIIILSTVVISYNNIIGDTNKREFATEIYKVEKQVEQYEFLNGKLPVYGSDLIVSLSNADMLDQFSNETIADSKVTLKVIDLTEAGVESVKRGAKESGDLDIYAISETTKNIYYIKGVNFDSKNYYTLTDDLLKLIDINKIK